MIVPLLPQDKASHFVYGFGFFILFSLFVNNLTALCFTLIISSIKELYDSRHDGNVNVMDIVDTVIPGIILFLISLIH